jgi:hypothetical protein
VTFLNYFDNYSPFKWINFEVIMKVMVSTFSVALVVLAPKEAQSGYPIKFDTSCKYESHEFNINFSTRDYPKRFGSNGSEYANYIEDRTPIIGNNRIVGVAFSFNRFKMEYYYDNIAFENSKGRPSFTGDKAVPFDSVVSTRDDHSLQSRPLGLHFRTDYSVGSPTNEGWGGFAIKNATAYCGLKERGIKRFYPPKVMKGILLGEDDVVHFKVPVIYEEKDIVPTVVTWNRFTMEAKIDISIYAGCGARPTPSNWDYKSTTIGENSEYMHLGNKYSWWYMSEVSDCDSSWYIAVHSFDDGPFGDKGAVGSFNIAVHKHYPSQHHNTFQVGTKFDASNQKLRDIKDAAIETVQHLYGVTEGTLIYDKVEVFNNGDCSCNGFKDPGEGSGDCSVCLKDSPIQTSSGKNKKVGSAA